MSVNSVRTQADAQSRESKTKGWASRALAAFLASSHAHYNGPNI
ncbi:hypothetical protein [Rhodovulum sp. PH10]|nr:hypothetical protein [Rhodovulum sp. PH10]